MSNLPKQYRKTSVKKLSADFRAATEIITVPTPTPDQLKANHVLVKNIYVGINASDINFTNGKYLPGVRPPFDAGFEAVGVVAAVSSKSAGKSSVQPGTTVVYSLFGAFAEYTVVPVKMLTPFGNSAPKAELMPLLVSGLTASIGLEEAGEMKTVAQGDKKKVVLVTAAAGATGLFAVQLASLAGHHVIGTCSSDDKAAELQKLGCHRVVNYKKEDLGDVLKKEYKKGVDIVYECVGGSMYDAAVRNLARFGKLIVIGFIAGYADGSGWKGSKKSEGNIDVKVCVVRKLCLPARVHVCHLI